MPNWCYNRITVYGNEQTEKIKEVEKIFESKTPFNDIFPMPRLEEHTKRERRVAKVRATQKPKDGEVILGNL